ncbi:MAG: DoxX family protein [Woeseiaceae bacterium]|jgi:putative oxidoreductase|nr:DoxX family protein [Woeseiaceae bacterium]
MKAGERILFLIGRSLLGLYFIVPGIMKVTGFSGTAEYMAAHGMIFVPFFLVLTIIIQIGSGICLVMGYRMKEIAFILAGLVLVISLVMHNFWSLEEGIQKGHEMQNFVKNMAIMAGLMVLAGGVSKLESNDRE